LQEVRGERRVGQSQKTRTSLETKVQTEVKLSGRIIDPNNGKREEAFVIAVGENLDGLGGNGRSFLRQKKRVKN